MADRKNQFEHTSGAAQFSTVLLVRDGDGNYRIAAPGNVNDDEITVGRGTCWAKDEHSFNETGRTLLDRAGVVNGRKRW